MASFSLSLSRFSLSPHKVIPNAFTPKNLKTAQSQQDFPHSAAERLTCHGKVSRAARLLCGCVRQQQLVYVCVCVCMRACVRACNHCAAGVSLAFV